MIFAVDLQMGGVGGRLSLGSGHFYEDPQPDLGGAPRDPRGTPVTRKYDEIRMICRSLTWYDML